MTRQSVPVVLLLAMAAAPVAAQVYRANTDVVVLNVTVTDGESRFVANLNASDFLVLEDGIPQVISNFTRDPQPVALSILLDTSTSMERKLPIAQEAAIGFARRLGPKDVGQIVAFDSHEEILQDFTNDRVALEKAIRRTHVGGSTALYTALYTGLTDLKRIRAESLEELRRQALIVLSDGEDTSSLVDFDMVLELSKRTGVTVYAIGLRTKGETPPHGYSDADYVLRTLSQETGGRVFHVEDMTQLPAIYQQIADELANQYTIGYSSKNVKRDGAFRRVSVRVVRPGVAARTKTGYFAPAPAR